MSTRSETSEARLTVATAHHVSKYIGNKAIVDDVSLEVHAGQVVLLTGESGSGKSTVLRMLAGIEEPSKGTVKLFNTNMASISARHRRELIANQVGIGFQAPNLDTNFSVWDNFVGLNEARGQKINYDVAAHLLERLKLSDKLDDRAQTLSGGEKLRLSLARIMLSQPDLLLLDEPTYAIDHIGKREVFDDLSATCRDLGTAALIVTHDKGVARPIANREYVMQSGIITGEYQLPRDIPLLTQMDAQGTTDLQPA
jgi:putative ABC transport system ATP-binding protein